MGPPGCGKNVITNFVVGQVLGSALAMNISKTDAITGKFNPPSAGKRFVVHDEVGVPKHNFHAP